LSAVRETDLPRRIRPRRRRRGRLIFWWRFEKKSPYPDRTSNCYAYFYQNKKCSLSDIFCLFHR